MEYLWIIGFFAALGFIGWVSEQVEIYRNKERSKQRDQIAREELSKSGIGSTHNAQLIELLGSVTKYLPGRSTIGKDGLDWAGYVKSMNCPGCETGHIVKVRKGSYNEFRGCSNFPACRFNSSINDQKRREASTDWKFHREQKVLAQKDFMEDFREAYQ